MRMALAFLLLISAAPAWAGETSVPEPSATLSSRSACWGSWSAAAARAAIPTERLTTRRRSRHAGAMDTLSKIEATIAARLDSR